jgi:hypothetical protein
MWSYFQACMNLDNVSFVVAVYGMKLMCTLELNQLTGIAAILTFPLDVEVVEQEEREAEEERQREAPETA